MAFLGSARLLGIFLLIHSTQSALISSPFDNFRIECPQNAGAQRLSIRMVESQGMKRQDSTFSISCNRVSELYPWNGIPSELAAHEREECHYSVAFDPIMDTQGELSCGPREYIVSVVRLYGTKIQVGCCKLRTRDETNCIVQRFGKPYGVDVRTEIENRAMLINAIAVEGNSYRVRFCDLAPRAAGLIVEDAKRSALKTSTTTSTTPQTTQQSTTTPQTTQSVTQTSEEPTTETTVPKKVIKVKKPVSSNITQSENETTTQIPTTNETIDLKTILQPQQSRDQINENEITSVQRSLHGTSIVEGTVKLKDTPQGLAKIADNESSKIESTTINIDIETSTELPSSSTTDPSTESTPLVQTTIIEKEEESTTSIPVKDTQSTAGKTEKTTEEIKTTEDIKTTAELTTLVTEASTSEQSTTNEQSTTSASTTTAKKQTTESPTTNQVTTKKQTTSQVATKKSTETTTEQTTAKMNDGEAHPEFVATDSQNTETMFPKMPMIGDYDDEESKESDKLMKSIMQMMDAQKELKKLTKQLKENVNLNEKSNDTQKEEVTTSKTTVQIDDRETTTESAVLIVPREKKKPMADGQTKMDVKKPEKAEKQTEVVQADQVPTESQDERDGEKRLDEFVDRAPFDFSAFPQAPKNIEPTKETVELPRYTRLQTKPTRKPHLPIASTTTKEPEYIVADRLDDIPEPISLKPRRTTTLRRRPTSQSPNVDEETNNSPFDVGGDDAKSTNKDHKTDSAFVDANINPRDLFDSQDSSYEHANEGRFSLPTESRFSQRSPFEIRRAPTPHLKEAYNAFDIAEKYVFRTQRPQGVDILFEESSSIEEMPSTSTVSQTVPQISHKDGERYFTPVDNKPMKAPEPSMIPQLDEHPTKLTFLRRKQHDSMRKQPLPDSSMDQQLVPMTETSTNQQSSSPATVALPPLVPVTRTRPTTIQSTTTQEAIQETTPSMTTQETVQEATTTQETTQTVIEEAPASESQTEVYNPVNFYHTVAPPSRKHFLREKVLTFCSKDTAIRDQNQMVIACGTDSEVWSPNRCPSGTDCFSAPDSLYRICCPVGSK